MTKKAMTDKVRDYRQTYPVNVTERWRMCGDFVMPGRKGSVAGEDESAAFWMFQTERVQTGASA
ncbi:MAG: hypothetical protein EA399_14465 [Desulfovibrionales bacterium]|nr:MAG: hypothetical protein EA399_14465 [Desulfovibrionales bacterium]